MSERDEIEDTSQPVTVKHGTMGEAAFLLYHAFREHRRLHDVEKPLWIDLTSQEQHAWVAVACKAMALLP